uniref:Uncharacterized protein n=1 Tax=Haemonchus contortus TaxID=6289 RepID=A0A7I4Y2M1_HAECO
MVSKWKIFDRSPRNQGRQQGFLFTYNSEPRLWGMSITAEGVNNQREESRTL